MSLPLAAEYCSVGTAMLGREGPKPVRIGRKRLVWLKEDLDKWLDGLAGKETTSSPAENPWDKYVFGANETPSHL
jgi:hypothetical protein